MKYLSTLLLTVILMLSSATYAQSKVAHLDFQKLISEMPSVIAAQEEVQKKVLLGYPRPVHKGIPNQIANVFC